MTRPTEYVKGIGAAVSDLPDNDDWQLGDPDPQPGPDIIPSNAIDLGEYVAMAHVATVETSTLCVDDFQRAASGDRPGYRIIAIRLAEPEPPTEGDDT